MDFYIFWKFGFCRTPPSLRQLFYPLVNLLIPPSLPSHPSPFPIYPTHPSSLTLLLFKYPPTLHSRSSSHIIHSFPLFPPFTYPQLIHKLLTAFPQPLTLLIDLLSTPISLLILLFLQSSPL